MEDVTFNVPAMGVSLDRIVSMQDVVDESNHEPTYGMTTPPEQDPALIITTKLEPQKIKKTEAIATKSYALLMAESLGVAVTAEDIATLTTLTVAECNRKLVSMSREQGIARSTSITNEQMSTLSAIGMARTEDLIRNIEGEIRSNMGTVENYQSNIQTYLSKCAELNRQMRAIKAQGVDITTQLREVLTDAWYTLHSVSGNKITLLTPRIMCRYFDQENQIDRSVDLGSMKVVVDMVRATLVVKEHEDNLIGVANGYIHPHIDTSGGVCWGTAHDAYTKLAFCQIKEPLMALKVILQTYNPDSPYVRFNEFEEMRAQKAALEGKYGDALPTDGMCRIVMRLSARQSEVALENITHLKEVYFTTSKLYTVGYVDRRTQFAYVEYADGSLGACAGSRGAVEIATTSDIGSLSPKEKVAGWSGYSDIRHIEDPSKYTSSLYVELMSSYGNNYDLDLTQYEVGREADDEVYF